MKLRIAIIVVLAAGLTGLLSTNMFGRGLEDRLGAFVLFNLRGPRPSPPGVVVIGIDRASAEALDLSSLNRPWPRSLHSRALEKLAAHSPAVIAFDLMFGTPDPANDDALATAFRRSGRVVLLRGLERRIVGAGSVIQIDRPIDPVPILADAAAAVAPFPLPKVPARVDRFWTFNDLTGGPTVPSVILQLTARDIATRWAALLSTEPSLGKFDGRDWTGPNVTGVMQQLHAAVRANPAATERLRARLRTEAWSDGDKRRLATLIALYAGDDSRYLNFYGPAGSIRTISYAKLLSGASTLAAPVIDSLSGKVVFIGASELHSTTQVDSYDTVYSTMSGINVSGVEIAATALANLAETSSPQRPAEAAVAEIVLVALALAGATIFGRMVVLLAAGTLIAVSVLAVGWYAFLTQNWLMPVANPLLFQIPIGVLAGAWCFRVEERRQRQTMVQAAGQYLPEAVVRSLASGPLSGSAPLAGEVHYSVCLASDIEGFTTFSEQLPPDTVQRLLNQYFGGMFEVVQRHGGAISDIAGDGVMCVWTAPVVAPSACIGAVGAAMGVLEVVENFNRTHPNNRLPTRIGIHAGSVLVGVVGGAGRYASTIVGDVANTASRIEGLNKQLGTRLLASEEALSQVTGFILRPLGDFLLAGKSQWTGVSEVLGRVGDPKAAALAGAFANAFEAFRSRRWDEAITLLEALLRAYPQDGPSRYFLERAKAERATRV